MKFQWNPNLATGGCELSAHPDDYDGHPTPDVFRLDYSPRFASPGRLAVAAVLAFRSFVAGELTFPSPIAPELARSIIEFLDPVAVFPQPLDFQPKAVPLGTGLFVVEPDGIPSPADAAPGGPSVARLRLPSAGEGFGHSLTRDTLTVPTNATLLVPASEDPLARLGPFVAAAVLLAEDFGIGTLQLPRVAAPQDSSLRRLAGLLEAGSLSLTWTD